MSIWKRMIAIAVLLLCLPAVGSMAVAVPEFSVGSVSAAKGSTVLVPVHLAGNTGICGATISVSYDDALTLTEITRGEALGSLVMTKPGDFSSNSVNLVFDGVEPDATNGILVNLIFLVPERTGIYEISLSSVEGDIVDGNLNPVHIAMKAGSIEVSGESEDGEDEGPAVVVPKGPMLIPDSINTTAGQRVDLPIRLWGNTGICGATISVTYDSALTLTGITKGDALSTLTMTRTGSLSESPIKLVFDGVEADYTNGSIAVLGFMAPIAVGNYEVSVSYESGDIVDGNLQPIEVVTEKGEIVVGGTATRVVIGSKTVIVPTKQGSEGTVITAFYTAAGELCTLYMFPANRAVIKTDMPASTDYVKIIWWTQALHPAFSAKIIKL